MLRVNHKQCVSSVHTHTSHISTSLRHDYYPMSTPVRNIISSPLHSLHSQIRLGEHCFECTIIQILRPLGALQLHYSLYREWSVRKPNPDYRLTVESLSDCHCLHCGQALFRVTNVFRRSSGLATISRNGPATISRKGPTICGRVSAGPPSSLRRISRAGVPRYFVLSSASRRLRGTRDTADALSHHSPWTSKAAGLPLTGDRSPVAARPRLCRCYATAPGPRAGLSSNGPKDPSGARAG